MKLINDTKLNLNRIIAVLLFCTLFVGCKKDGNIHNSKKNLVKNKITESQQIAKIIVAITTKNLEIIFINEEFNKNSKVVQKKILEINKNNLLIGQELTNIATKKLISIPDPLYLNTSQKLIKYKNNKSITIYKATIRKQTLLLIDLIEKLKTETKDTSHKIFVKKSLPKLTKNIELINEL